MNKVILKSSLITIGALAAAAILIFSLWILISPQSMAAVSEKIGNYDFAATCSDLKYKYSDKTDDLAHCAEDSILAKNDKLIIKYCEALIEKSDYDALCRQRNEEFLRTQYGELIVKYDFNYDTYIRGTLAAAQYRKGALEKAVVTAENGSFDCFRKLLIEIVSRGSEEDIARVQTLPEDEGIRVRVTSFIELYK